MANRQLLARATEGTAAPTPGYLYNDLTQSAQSSPTAASEMADYLINRLTGTHNVHTKSKCLTVISKLCDSCLAFKRSLAQRPQNVQALRDSIRHSGPPDPVCGDALHQKIRAAAQQALEAVYREDPVAAAAPRSQYAPNNNYGPAYGQSGGAAGYGNNAPNSSARRMEGIGNPRYQDPRLDPNNSHMHGVAVPANIAEVAHIAGDVILGMIKDPLARNHHVQKHGNLPGSPNKYSNGYDNGSGRVGELSNYSGSRNFGPPPGAAQLAQQTGGQWTMASNRGPNAIGRSEHEQYYPQQQQQAPNHNNYRASQGTVGGSWGANGHSAPSLTVSNAPLGIAHSAPASDGTYEKNLMLELCPPGGMKAVPPSDKLASFAKMLPSLNADLICPVLLDCLEEGQPWIVRAKALCVMETCLRSGVSADGNSNPYRDFFHACQGEIVPLTAHPRAPIKDPAKRIVALMGGADAGYEVAAAVPEVVVNLLDFDIEPVGPAPTSAPPPAPVASAPDMFGGMHVKAKSEAAVNEPSLLDFGNDTPATAASAVSYSNDIFRDVGAKDVPTTPMFQNMTLMDGGGEDKKSDSEDAGDLQALSAPTGSAFGFINAGSKDEQFESTKPNFDPLTGPVSPSATAKAILHMTQSPEQMQAMAYQHMMMQQRMQMQMAYAMQQQGGRPMPFPVGMAGNNVMAPNLSMNNPVRNAFAKPAKTDDHKFDFVKDAMKTQSKK